MRLIDADAIPWTNIGTDETKVLITFADKVNKMPTIEERKTGFWYALEKGDKGYSAGDFKCSACGEPNHTWLPKLNFCPNCGADMRGEEDE